ncbi:uncharacterized protein LOC115633239 [Scaptodrosophila lebanonensis]|uniref:Uncharacterized protein LOC115633239 n=1 Tax=Drosophila lebanonensis TaxID=7225 RepID=A0A6J2UEB0_DROLE|nr:uncharacterized protein LOC115633239 [Scaptodrosophila lebanonensis]
MTVKRLKCDFSPEVTTCLRMRDSRRPDCCPIHDRIPYDAGCFLKDISREVNELYNRHYSRFENSERLMELALPVHRKCPYVPRCPCRFQKDIEMVQSDPPMYTRTEQLALPLVRRLHVRRKEALVKGDKIAERVLNRWLRYSYLSLYSRLSNRQPMMRPPKPKKPSKKQRVRHYQYISTLAKPKQIPEPPKPKRTSGGMDARRLNELARPRTRLPETNPPWQLTRGMKFFKPSERLKSIAKPLIRDNVHIKEEPEKVARGALKYKPSSRIKEISLPVKVFDREARAAEIADDPYAISPHALKYRVSSRIKELAEPKEFANTHIRSNPGAISPAALRAKASPRLIELARPKGG